MNTRVQCYKVNKHLSKIQKGLIKMLDLKNKHSGLYTGTYIWYLAI